MLMSVKMRNKFQLFLVIIMVLHNQYSVVLVLALMMIVMEIVKKANAIIVKE